MSDSASVMRAEETVRSEEAQAAADAQQENVEAIAGGGPAVTEDEGRSRALEIVEQAHGLPPALRERLKERIAAGTEMSLAAVIAAVEESLPEYLRGSASAVQPPHPAGEAFFSGAAGEMSDSEAEALAQHQLQRAGLLRGQRVRVAD